MPVALGKQNRVAPADDQRRAGVGTAADAIFDERIEDPGTEPCGRRGALQGDEQQPYDHTPGIRRPQATQPPPAPIRCCRITYAWRSISNSPQSGHHVCSQRPTWPGRLPAHTNLTPAAALISHARSSVSDDVLSGSVMR